MDMNANAHIWKPIPENTAYGLISSGLYQCIICGVIGSKNIYEYGETIKIERCCEFNCIAPAKYVNYGNLLCEAHARKAGIL